MPVSSISDKSKFIQECLLANMRLSIPKNSGTPSLIETLSFGKRHFDLTMTEAQTAIRELKLEVYQKSVDHTLYDLPKGTDKPK